MVMLSKKERKAGLEAQMKKLAGEIKSIEAAEREQRKKEHDRILKDLGRVVYKAGVTSVDRAEKLCEEGRKVPKLKDLFMMAGDAEDGSGQESKKEGDDGTS